jgi:hypothetical protein
MTAAPPGSGELHDWMRDHLMPLEDGVWDDAEELQQRAAPALRRFGEPEVLPLLLEGCAVDERLRSLSDRRDFGDQMILFDDPSSGIRVRLHTWTPNDFSPHGRPHHHRYSFASIILRGEFLHSLYGDIEGVLTRVDGRPIRAIGSRTEAPGSVYALESTAVHTVRAQPGSLSMIVRGPAVSDYQVRFDKTGTWPSDRKYGRASEPAAERPEETTTPDHVRALSSKLFG